MSKQIPGLLESLKGKYYYQLLAQGEEEDLKGSVPSLVLGEYLGSPASPAITLLLAFKLLTGKQTARLALTREDAGEELSTPKYSLTPGSPQAKTFSLCFWHQPVKFRPFPSEARG